MNEFMNDIALTTFSSFDIAESAAKNDAPERFYHGFVLGLMVELKGSYEVTSNRVDQGCRTVQLILSFKDVGLDDADPISQGHGS